MVNVDWTAVILGFAVGIAMGALFFVGLAAGMRLALRSESPVRLLSLSAALRIAALLGAAWFLVGQVGPWAGLGYAIAFFIARFIAMTFVRVSAPAGGAP